MRKSYQITTGSNNANVLHLHKSLSRMRWNVICTKWIKIYKNTRINVKAY